MITEREKQILELMATDATRKEIAAKLAISVRTVEMHVNNIRSKMGLRMVYAALYQFGYDVAKNEID